MSDRCDVDAPGLRTGLRHWYLTPYGLRLTTPGEPRHALRHSRAGRASLADASPEPTVGRAAGGTKKQIPITYTTQVAGRSILTIAQVPLTHLPGLPA